MTALRRLWRGLCTVPGHWVAAVVFLSLTNVVPPLVTALRPVDYSLQDTYYVVAHIRYMVGILGMFAAFACIYQLFTRIFSVAYRPWLARLHFWTLFIGVNIMVLPQYVIGLEGTPRRYVDYPMDFEIANRISSTGYVIILVSFLVFIAVMVEAFIARRKPGPRMQAKDIF